MVPGNKINIQRDKGTSKLDGSTAFVKLYLFEKDLIPPLEQHLRTREASKGSKFRVSLQKVKSKCSGLEVYAPCFTLREESKDGLICMNEEIMEQIYGIFKEYLANFKPNLSPSQVLLYIYKQFFNLV